ncbi:DUF1048 domain-containing protein [Microbacterium sediminis]|uniref:Uncharacterized protein n=1 Tax=Microbacterium sediminis TaxID=904291 RepID=A0A1B9NCM4_9MICO|nr:DUF1048 domain-containing protein [Microbacterium sediminis]OCG74294.1 hypothetical protein A7J15_05480 [Microbacterium sediminis]QBR73656.1 DUF1048 domain-containing protein [Microbacterium sediminis]
MAAGWIEKLTGSIEQKKQYRQYKARLEALPGEYRVAAQALDRYVMYAGGIADGEVMMRMFGDLADLFEEHAAAGTPTRDIVGDDPVEFAEEFVSNYSDGGWITKEKERLKKAIDGIDAGGAS